MSEKIVKLIQYGRRKVGQLELATQIHSKYPKFSNRVSKIMDWSERNPLKAVAIFPAKFAVKVFILYYAGKYIKEHKS